MQIAFLCHRRPERSFFYHGKQFPICARCTGIMAGYGIGILSAVFGLRCHGLLGIFLLALPLIVDGGLQYKTAYESTNYKRFLTGILFGIAIIDLLLFLHFLAVDMAWWTLRQFGISPPN